MFRNLCLGEILLILLIVLILFGGKKIPDLARGLGKSVREFRRAARGDDDESRTNGDQKKTGQK